MFLFYLLWVTDEKKVEHNCWVEEKYLRFFLLSVFASGSVVNILWNHVFPAIKAESCGYVSLYPLCSSSNWNLRTISLQNCPSSVILDGDHLRTESLATVSQLDLRMHCWKINMVLLCLKSFAACNIFSPWILQYLSCLSSHQIQYQTSYTFQKKFILSPTLQLGVTLCYTRFTLDAAWTLYDFRIDVKNI